MGKKLKYLCFLLGIILILIALFLPQRYPYHSWLNERTIPLTEIKISLPLFNLIGDVFYIFSLGISPLVLLLYFSDKYLNQEKDSKVFFKLPLIALLVSVLGYIISLYFGQFNVCSGEECMGVVLAFVLTVPLTIIISFILAGVIYYVNRKDSAVSIKKKINDLANNRSLHICFFVFVVILLLTSIILSYNCYSFLTKRNGDCNTYKLYSNEEEIFFNEKFPEDILGLKRSYAISACPKSEEFNALQLTGTEHNYHLEYTGKEYSYINAGSGSILKNKDNYVIDVYLYKDNKEINELMSVVRTNIEKNSEEEQFSEIFSLSAFLEERQINGNNIFCTYSDYIDKYFHQVYIHDDCIWYNDKEDYIIKIKGNGPSTWRNDSEGISYQNKLKQVLEYTLEGYPSSSNAFY